MREYYQKGIPMKNIKSALIQHPDYYEALLQRKKQPNILIAPTNYCNFSCTYCATKLHKGKHVNMNLELLRKIIQDCISNNWQFGFGQTYEPFLHPEIDQIIRMVENHGKRFHSATNGSIFKRNVYDLPMDLMISFSENMHDLSYRRSAYDFGRYQDAIFSFLTYRLENSIPGVITFELADYSLLEQEDSDYNKEIERIDDIVEKARRITEWLSLDRPPETIRDAIKTKSSVLLGQSGPCKIQCLSTKIMPSTYEAFTGIQAMPLAPTGYCDSCFAMMSIQADGGIAYCCCDPTAKNIFFHMTPDDNLTDIWNGTEIENIRDSFLHHSPPNRFCKQCLYPVSEHIKPLLTKMDKSKVKEILNGFGIHDNLPWFEMD